MKKLFFSLFIPAIVGFSANAQTCQLSKGHQHNAPSNSKEIRASNMRSDTIDVLNYTINLNITDFTTNTIRGNTVVKFTPKQNNISTIDLDLLELIVDSVEVNSNNLTYTYNDTLLSVQLGNTYNVNDTVSLTVYYHGTPQGDASGWGGFYFQSGYAYNLGVGFAADPHVYGRVWFPCFDNFVERSSYEFNIVTNNGKTSYCNGYLASDTTDGSGNRTRKWIMEEQIPTYLASVAVAAYTQVNQTYNGINGPTPIVLTALPADTTNVKNSFVNLNTALSTYENHFGPYMWNRVGYCMVPFNSGAMEHATNIAYPRATANGTLQYQTLYAHELSHHWFGDLATCRTAEDMWLNEGWARYCEFLFTEALSGPNAYRSAVSINHEDNLHFNIVKEGALSLSNIPHAYTYGDHVYNKGADVAHTMRGYLGDSTFFAGVKAYLAQHNYDDVSSADFMNDLTTITGVDMSYFFNDWVNNPGWCHFSVDSFNVVPQTGSFDVTVYLKQKLTAAPNFYQHVPLNITFKDAAFNQYVSKVEMNGQFGTFTINVPFDPAFVAVNMDEKISHAVAPAYKVISTTGAHNLTNAKMNLTVNAIVDSAFVRVEHNYTAPDTFKIAGMGYRLSPNHYWRVDGILPAVFKAKAVLNYDGRTSSFSGNMWLDNQLITTFEDSLVLMYRRNAADDWKVYPYYTKSFSGNNNDKRGTITIDTLELGEYVFAMQDAALGITEAAMKGDAQLTIYPNPVKNELKVDISKLKVAPTEKLIITITDLTGKIIRTERWTAQQSLNSINTSAFSNGIYVLSVGTESKPLAQSKFIVSH